MFSQSKKNLTSMYAVRSTTLALTAMALAACSAASDNGTNQSAQSATHTTQYSLDDATLSLPIDPILTDDQKDGLNLGVEYENSAPQYFKVSGQFSSDELAKGANLEILFAAARPGVESKKDSARIVAYARHTVSYDNLECEVRIRVQLEQSAKNKIDQSILFERTCNGSEIGQIFGYYADFGSGLKFTALTSTNETTFTPFKPTNAQDATPGEIARFFKVDTTESQTKSAGTADGTANNSTGDTGALTPTATAQATATATNQIGAAVLGAVSTDATFISMPPDLSNTPLPSTTTSKIAWHGTGTDVLNLDLYGLLFLMQDLATQLLQKVATG